MLITWIASPAVAKILSMSASKCDDTPEYWSEVSVERRRRLGQTFARQIRLTLRPFLSKALSECEVLDVGSGWGHTAIELAQLSRSVVGIEPSRTSCDYAMALADEHSVDNIEFINGTLADLAEGERFDVVILDNVFEHIEDQVGTLRQIDALLRPGGVVFILVPNKLWPIEAHYGLPFLSYLPLPAANAYLRLTGRGTDYRDASYAPTYRRMRRLLRAQSRWEVHFTLPADPSATVGSSRLYGWGMAAIRRIPALWAISKAFLIVAVKR